MTASSATEGGKLAQYLTFWLGSEVFGMDIRAVREMIEIILRAQGRWDGIVESYLNEETQA